MSYVVGNSRNLCQLILKPGISVLYSKSNCPFENLAFEDYVYEKVYFDEHQKLLFLWRNNPAVVIGRHQNTWNEVNLKHANEENVIICRRKSGGGSVYHDLGNVNLTFFTNRSQYDRKSNLDFIITAMNETYGVNLTRNQKDDILLDKKFKVSGTAAKLGLRTAYHHCTLLCNTNLAALSGLLKRSFGEVDTNATQSVRSLTANIFGEKFDFLDLGEQFCRQYQILHKQRVELQSINPSKFSTVPEKIQELKSWNWIYGKSPKFCITKQLLLRNTPVCELVFTVKKGVISDVEIRCASCIENTADVSATVKKLIGVRFNSHDVSTALEATSSLSTREYEKQFLSWLDF